MCAYNPLDTDHHLHVKDQWRTRIKRRETHAYTRVIRNKGERERERGATDQWSVSHAHFGDDVLMDVATAREGVVMPLLCAFSKCPRARKESSGKCLGDSYLQRKHREILTCDGGGG